MTVLWTYAIRIIQISLEIFSDWKWYLWENGNEFSSIRSLLPFLWMFVVQVPPFDAEPLANAVIAFSPARFLFALSRPFHSLSRTQWNFRFFFLFHQNSQQFRISIWITFYLTALFLIVYAHNFGYYFLSPSLPKRLSNSENLQQTLHTEFILLPFTSIKSDDLIESAWNYSHRICCSRFFWKTILWSIYACIHTHTNC